MKNIALLLFGFFAFTSVNAQSITTDSEYQLRTKIQEKEDAYAPLTMMLHATNDSEDILGSFQIADQDLVDEVHITTMKDPGLDGISEVVKVEVAYSACCVYVVSHYFMITDEQDVIMLPQLENTYCEDTNTEIVYSFPNDVFGTPGLIVKAEQIYDDAAAFAQGKVLNSIAWKDDFFGEFPIAYTEGNE